MKEKTTLKKWIFLSQMSCDAIKEKLEKMALDGWKLKSVNKLYEFEKIEPKKLTYTVDFFPQASIYDTKPEEESLNYLEYCKEAGWELVAMVGTMHIFVSESEKAIPIQTDESLKFDTLKKSIIKTKWILWILIPLIFSFNIFIQFLNFESLITSNLALFSILVFLVVILFNLFDFFIYLHWKNKNSKRVKYGEKIEYIGLSAANKIAFIQLAIPIVLFIFIPIIFFIILNDLDFALMFDVGVISAVIILGLSYLWQRGKFSRTANKIFPFLLSFLLIFSIGFTTFFLMIYGDGNVGDNKKQTFEISDFMENLDSKQEFYLDKSIFASREEVYVYNGDTIFEYKIFKSNMDFILNKYYNDNYKIGYMNEKNNLWEANEVLINESRNKLIVIYDNAIVEFKWQTNFTKEQIYNIKSKLKNS